jgi:hypothetical protein
MPRGSTLRSVVKVECVVTLLSLSVLPKKPSVMLGFFVFNVVANVVLNAAD